MTIDSAPFAARDAEIAELLQKRVTLAEIGKRFGISRQRVHQIGVRLGVTDRRKKRRRADVVEPDPVCTCGHVADEHALNGTCTIDDCLCGGWEEQ